MVGFLPDDTPAPGLPRVYAPDAASTVLEPRVACPRTREQIALADACYSTCLATCGTTPQWTQVTR